MRVELVTVPSTIYRDMGCRATPFAEQSIGGPECFPCVTMHAAIPVSERELRLEGEIHPCTKN